MLCTFCNSRHVHKKLWIDGRTHAMCKACQVELYMQTMDDGEFETQREAMRLILRRRAYEAGTGGWMAFGSYPA